MHQAEREKLMMSIIERDGFVAFQALEALFDASPATLRRDLERMAQQGRLTRVRGGAKSIVESRAADVNRDALSGVPFHENIVRMREEKERIGRAAAAMCVPNEAVMIDGGSTTLQMCPHLDGLNLQVLTNSLHIVSGLMSQPGTRVQVPGGSVFREQNIILSAVGDDLMPRFVAPKLFMGAASIGSQGLTQADVVLVAAERRLIERAEKVIVLVDSSKFEASSGQVVCGLDEVDVVITDDGIQEQYLAMLTKANVEVVIAKN